jgi:hypothetical protein
MDSANIVAARASSAAVATATIRRGGPMTSEIFMSVVVAPSDATTLLSAQIMMPSL